VAIDAAAEAGTDSFGIRGGGAGGMGGSGATGTGTGAAGGLGAGFYSGYLQNALRTAVQNDKRVRNLVFKAIFAITVDGQGNIIQASLVDGSGDAKRDEMLLAVLQAVRGLEPPPPSIKFPARIVVSGRRGA
jgi:hypothetical protein